MSPVHAMRVCVHSIYAWQQIHVWMQTRFQWSETILDGSRMLRQRWQGTWKSQYAKERILIWKDRMTAAVKSRHNTPTASEDDEKLTAEDEKVLSQTSHNNHFRLACHLRITSPVLKTTSTGAIPPSRAKWVSISSLLHRCVEYTSTRRLHLPKCVFTILVMVGGDVQVNRLLVGDVQVDRSTQGICFVSYSLLYHCTRVGECRIVYVIHTF